MRKLLLSIAIILGGGGGQCYSSFHTSSYLTNSQECNLILSAAGIKDTKAYEHYTDEQNLTVVIDALKKKEKNRVGINYFPDKSLLTFRGIDNVSYVMDEFLNSTSITPADIERLVFYKSNGISLDPISWSNLRELVIDEYSEEPDNTLLEQISSIGLAHSKLENLVLDSLVNVSMNYFLYNSSTGTGCTSLTSASFAKLESVSGVGFLIYCTGLESLVLPNTLQTVGQAFLGYCTGLESLVLPNTLETVGSNFLALCTGLKSLVLSSTLHTVGNNFLGGCTGLTSLVLPNTLETVGSRFLGGCTGLKSLVLPNTLHTVESDFLIGCTGLTSLVLPNTLQTVGYGFLGGCTGLSSLELPNTLQTVGDWFLVDCTGLKELTVKGAINSIGDLSVDTSKIALHLCEAEYNRSDADTDILARKWRGYIWGSIDQLDPAA